MLTRLATRIVPAAFLVGGFASGILLGGSAVGASPRTTQPVTLMVGQQLFAAECAVCHGPAGDGAGGAPRLDTGLANFTSEAALAWFIRKNMPATAPDSLSPGQANALAMYLWLLNHPSR